MLLDILLLVLGIGCLAGGGETLVRGAVDVARHFRLSTAVIGLTVVAAGTSMPELWVSMSANLNGVADFAVGNVIGSNIFNIAFVLGIASLICVIPVRMDSIKLEWPFLMITSLLFALLVGNGTVGRWEGALLVLLLVGFLWFMIAMTRRNPDLRHTAEEMVEESASAKQRSMAVAFGYVVIGLVLLPVGAELVIRGGSGIAADLGISERVIGITILAIGTSLPELASSLVAAARGQSDIAVGNIIGSNLFNTLGIVGTTALVRPLPVQAAFERDIVWMLGFTLLLLVVLMARRRIARLEGVVLLVPFLAYMTSLFLG